MQYQRIYAFLLMVDNEEFVAVPNRCKEMPWTELYNFINKLLCDVANFAEMKAHSHSVRICVHFYEMDSCVWAHYNLSGLACCLYLVYMS